MMSSSKPISKSKKNNIFTGTKRSISVRSSKNEDASLSRYLNKIGAHASLEADEEMAMAKGIFELEHGLFSEMLGTPSLLPIIENALAESAPAGRGASVAKEISGLLSHPASSKKSNVKKLDMISSLSYKLMELDEDRTLVSRVLKGMETGRGFAAKDAPAIKDRRNELARMADRIMKAKHRFIKENLGLVVNIAKRYRVDNLSLSDLIQEGNLGLMRALDKFDYQKGFRFSTYASWWIRSYITRAIVRKASTVRIPEYMLRDRNRIKRTEEAHRVKEGSNMSEDDLVSKLGLSKKRLQRTLRHDVSFIESLDREMPGNDNQKYVDFLADEEAKTPLEMVSFNDWLKRIPKTMENLSVVERFVISWRFGLVDGNEMTLQEIGQCLSLSRERIRQIQEEALVKLRDDMETSAA